jgi:hypothetical protein
MDTGEQRTTASSRMRCFQLAVQYPLVGGWYFSIFLALFVQWGGYFFQIFQIGIEDVTIAVPDRQEPQWTMARPQGALVASGWSHWQTWCVNI